MVTFNGKSLGKYSRPMDPMAVKQWEGDGPKLCETVDDQQRDQTLSPLNVTRLLPFE